MPPLGWRIDHLIGHLSRGLHLRRARLNTVSDLGRYLGLPPDVLFPAPIAPVDVRRRPSRLPCLPAGRGRAVEVLRWRSQHVPLCPRYRVRHSGAYASNETASARWMHPRSGQRRRALVYVHGWLEPGPWPEQLFFLPHVSDALDVDVLHLQLPFHGDRNPHASLFHGELFWTADLVRSIEAVRQSCMDARSLVAWLREQGYVEVGVTGFSMGASIAMVLACLDPTPDYVIPIVGHLQLSDAIENAPIFWRMKTDLERFGIDRDGRKEIFDELGLERLRPRLPPERQLWIMARDDGYVTAPRVEEQWRAWGRPPIEWIPGGHMTFAFSLPRIIRRMTAFHAGLRATAPPRLVALQS
jgi:pimeloyl-ACP methyl ester carboxylesterase